MAYLKMSAALSVYISGECSCLPPPTFTYGKYHLVSPRAESPHLLEEGNLCSTFLGIDCRFMHFSQCGSCHCFQIFFFLFSPYFSSHADRTVFKLIFAASLYLERLMHECVLPLLPFLFLLLLLLRPMYEMGSNYSTSWEKCARISNFPRTSGYKRLNSAVHMYY